MIDVRRHGLFVRLFSSAILMQALLSAASLCVGLLLIRRTSDSEYGYYVLITNAVLLISALQGSYINPSLVRFLTDSGNDAVARGNFVGGMYREQRVLLTRLAFVLLAITSVLAALDVLGLHILMIVAAGTLAALFTLYREFFRVVLLAYRRPNDVLRGDALYALILVAGAFAATLSSAPAALAATALALAAFLGGGQQQKYLARHEMWNAHAAPDVLKQIYKVGAWAMMGAAIHWAFAQGYNYLIAGTLSITSVAAIAATRTLIMPVNLVSTGISSFMLPTVAAWLQRLSATAVMKRMLLLALGLVLATSLYLLVVWLCRDWLFATVLKKHFDQQNLLLALWCVVSIAMLLRDQLMYIVVARARFRVLSALTLVCAVLSLSASYFAMRKLGEAGALYGLLLGEIASVATLIVLSLRETNTVIA
ncbi:MAG: hypothetical protein QM808_13405 [Steroidobacteraceae bacterium]